MERGGTNMLTVQNLIIKLIQINRLESDVYLQSSDSIVLADLNNVYVDSEGDIILTYSKKER